MAEDFVKQLYDFVDGSVRHHLESPDNLKEFLTYLAGMRTDVSMRNKLLAYGYNPRATIIRTREAWEKDGFAILDEGAIIYNIQQVPGEKGHYTERVMYDVSSTDMQPEAFEHFPNAGFFAERLLMYPPCPVRFSDNPLVDNRRASYYPEKGIIEVTGGFKSEEHVCYGLLREFSHFYLHENEMRMIKKEGKDGTVEYNRDRHGIESQAISFAVCTRYGIEPPKLDVVHPPEGRPQDLMKILEGMDYSLQKISKLIDEGGMQQKRFLGQGNAVNPTGERGYQPRDSIQA